MQQIPAKTENRLPVHVAIIMDGNGRWAAQHGLPRSQGHKMGVEALRRAVKDAGELGISFLTIYSFSSENWRRPDEEIQDLMNLLRQFVNEDLERLHEANIRIKVIGNRENLDEDIRSMLDMSEDITKDNSGLILQIAFNYGSRDEILRAVKRLLSEHEDRDLLKTGIEQDIFASYLDTAGVPDPDLIIRTSGEQRLSNFLLWQAAYAEFVFLPLHWPDFDRKAFESALSEYARRKRRFGGVGPETNGE